MKNNINTEKKLIKEVSEQQNAERKSFESKMKQEYKLKKERWKREMAEVDTPKRWVVSSDLVGWVFIFAYLYGKQSVTNFLWTFTIVKYYVIKWEVVSLKLRQITLRIVGYHFSSRLSDTLNLYPIYLNLLVHVL